MDSNSLWLIGPKFKIPDGCGGRGLFHTLYAWKNNKLNSQFCTLCPACLHHSWVNHYKVLYSFLAMLSPNDRLWPSWTNLNCTKCILICTYTNQSELYNLETLFTWHRLKWELEVGNFYKKQTLLCLGALCVFTRVCISLVCYLLFEESCSFSFQCFLLDLFIGICPTEMKPKVENVPDVQSSSIHNIIFVFVQ